MPLNAAPIASKEHTRKGKEGLQRWEKTGKGEHSAVHKMFRQAWREITVTELNAEGHEGGFEKERRQEEGALEYTQSIAAIIGEAERD